MLKCFIERSGATHAGGGTIGHVMPRRCPERCGREVNGLRSRFGMASAELDGCQLDMLDDTGPLLKGELNIRHHDTSGVSSNDDAWVDINTANDEPYYEPATTPNIWRTWWCKRCCKSPPATTRTYLGGRGRTFGHRAEIAGREDSDF